MTERSHLAARLRPAARAALSFAWLCLAAVPLAAQEAAAEEHGAWTPLLGKILNFAALAAVLAYFLKSPLVSYLQSRGSAIRKDLADAAALRSSAERQVHDVRARVATLPVEIDALRRRGEEELQAERGRMKDATAREREKLLDRTRREIDLQFRLARRELVERVAELSMTRARARIERDITPDDQARLVDRYAAQVRS